MVDLADFDPFADDDVCATTNCAARAALAPQTAFTSLWDAAPHAQYPSALDSIAYLAWPPVQSEWTVTASACGNVTLTRTFTFAQLVGCVQRDGSTASVSVVTDTNGQVAYSGAVYASVVRPLDAQDETAGLQQTRHVFPFLFRFVSLMQALTSAESDQNFQLRSRTVSLANDTGCLQMQVQTVYVPGGITQLTNPTVQPPANGVALAVTGPDALCDPQVAEPCVQLWSVTSCPTPWDSAYNGEYLLRWTVNGTAEEVFALLSLLQAIAPDDSVQDLAFAHGLRMFRSSADWLSGTGEVEAGVGAGYAVGDTVFVRDTVAVAAGDEQNFELSVLNAWVCYSDNDAYVIEVADGKQGCADAFIRDDQRVQLVLDAVVLTDGTAGDFAVVIADSVDTPFVDSASVSAGVQFSAQPIAAQESRNYTVHLQLQLLQTSRRRHIIVDSLIASSAKRQADSSPTMTRSDVGLFALTSGDAASCAASDGVQALLLLLALVCAVMLLS